MSTIGPAYSLLNSFDPTNPAASLDSALTSAGLSDSYYQQGVAGTGPTAPGTQGPIGVPLATGLPTTPVSASNATPATAASGGLNLYQQSLQSLTEWSAQTLITAALNIGPGGTGATSTNDSAQLVSTLESWAQQQGAQQQQQQQAALTAANNALNAATQPTIDATA